MRKEPVCLKKLKKYHKGFNICKNLDENSDRFDVKA